MDKIRCPYCGAQVLPMIDERCPNCSKIISEDPAAERMTTPDPPRARRIGLSKLLMTIFGGLAIVAAVLAVAAGSVLRIDWVAKNDVFSHGVLLVLTFLIAVWFFSVLLFTIGLLVHQYQRRKDF